MSADPSVLDALRLQIAHIESGRSVASRDNEQGVQGGARHKAVRARQADNRSAGSDASLSCDQGGEADKAYRKIVRLASIRERSSTQAREKLLAAEFSPSAVEDALEKAVRTHVIDDRRYAEARVRQTIAQGKGLRMVARELEELGVCIDELDAYREHCAKGRSADLERALAVLEKSPPRSKNKREGAYRKLIARGYDSDTASSAARLWSESLL